MIQLNHHQTLDYETNDIIEVVHKGIDDSKWLEFIFQLGLCFHNTFVFNKYNVNIALNFTCVNEK
jgi:hypothetical protein